jgi:hypothetical protein
VANWQIGKLVKICEVMAAMRRLHNFANLLFYRLAIYIFTVLPPEYGKTATWQLGKNL